ncbi:hypothetical protein [Pseudoalteromonas luteoviolacea]|uniref:Uncharacterized protein n=1 Tax=Pseudoalteromonas luteoviolacea H33 TaxID=1365251 RepID=A0A167DD46_9GAMM|nr:hypothetical protein [Pseudoalteromonas luteoviolacea]KZN48690.1 hypothetical protein N476_20980 [Pseudoalteromonas luteoviolacea H33]KZN75475.1 hypothetical protein N477_01805 [Pseudoalteromonas luteoviolacea H33-S]
MKIKLNKKKIKALSNDTLALPVKLTPNIAGGGRRTYGPDHCNNQSIAQRMCTEEI